MLTKPGVVDRSQPASFLIHTSGKETDMATQRISAYQYWIVFGGAESVWAVLVGTWWYWVSRRRYWLISDGTGSL